MDKWMDRRTDILVANAAVNYVVRPNIRSDRYRTRRNTGILRQEKFSA